MLKNIVKYADNNDAFKDSSCSLEVAMIDLRQYSLKISTALVLLNLPNNPNISLPCPLFFTIKVSHVQSNCRGGHFLFPATTG